MQSAAQQHQHSHCTSQHQQPPAWTHVNMQDCWVVCTYMVTFIRYRMKCVVIKALGKIGYQPPSTRGVVSSEHCKSAGLPPAPCCCVWPGHNVPPPPQIFSRIKIFSDNLSARHVSSECSDSRSASPVSPRQRRVLIKIPQI